MAFIIPMAGNSSRFFDKGYTVPKYMLDMMGGSAFSLSVSSFCNYYDTDLFIFLVRSDYNSAVFVDEQVKILGIKDYKIITVNRETIGQADTVSLSLDEIGENEPLYIFNIDTCRCDYVKPSIVYRCDGYLEVFEGEGDAWSFVLPGHNNTVVRTAEKERISNCCSNGLYYFKNKRLYIEAFVRAKNANRKINGEYYIAPLYNELIKLGKDIRFEFVDVDKLRFFGTPEEYILLSKL